MVYPRILIISLCCIVRPCSYIQYVIVCICSSQTPNSSLPTPLSFGNHQSFGCDTFSVGYPLQQSAFKMTQAQWFSVYWGRRKYLPPCLARLRKGDLLQRTCSPSAPTGRPVSVCAQLIKPLAWGTEQAGCPLARTLLAPILSPTLHVAFDAPFTYLKAEENRGWKMP